MKPDKAVKLSALPIIQSVITVKASGVANTDRLVG